MGAPSPRASRSCEAAATISGKDRPFMARVLRTFRWPPGPMYWFRNRATRRGCEVTGAIEANLMDQLPMPGHGLHLQVDRRVPAQRGISGGVCIESHGWICAAVTGIPGEPDTADTRPGYAIKVEAFPTSTSSKRGHRIRVDVSSSNPALPCVNPDTGAPEGKGLTRRVSRIRCTWMRFGLPMSRCR